MGPGSPTDDKQPAAGPDPHPSPWEDPWASIADQNRWLEANLILERRYLELGRAQIDEMCLDLKARLAARMSAGLRDRLAAAPSPAVEISAPDIMAADVAHQVEAAAAMAAKLLNDISWVLPWEQAKSLVEPYARGSWLLAQIQVAEEQRVVSIFAAELTQQATSYMRDLIFRFYGVDQAPTSDAVRPAERPGTLEQG